MESGIVSLRLKMRYFKSRGKNGILKVNPFLSLGTGFESLMGIKLRKVYCIRLAGDKIILEPAPNQEKPQSRENKCFRAVVYRYPEKSELVMRISYLFLKKIRTPTEFDVYVDGDKLVLTPVYS